MDYMLKQAQDLVNEVFRTSEGGSEIESLAIALQNLIAYTAKKFNESDDEDEDED